MDESPILVETRPNFRIITLNRPQARNAVNAEMCIRVGDALGGRRRQVGRRQRPDGKRPDGRRQQKHRKEPR